MSMIDGALQGFLPGPGAERSQSVRKKVLSPIKSDKPGVKTRWVSMGSAFVNKDGSINVYLDGFPANGRLQLRDWDEEDRRRASRNGEQDGDEPNGGGDLPPF